MANDEGMPQEKQGTLWAEVLLVKRDVEGLRHEFAGVRTDIKDLRDLVQSVAKPREPRWSVWLTIVGMTGAAMLFLTNLIIGSAVRPLEDRSARSEATLSRIVPILDGVVAEQGGIRAQNATSITDRAELNRNDRTHEDRLAKLESQFSAEHADRVAHQIEIETQFRLSDQTHNVQWASTLRWVALIWQKTYGQPFPSDIQYYPGSAQPVAPNNNNIQR